MSDAEDDGETFVCNVAIVCDGGPHPISRQSTRDPGTCGHCNDANAAWHDRQVRGAIERHDIRAPYTGHPQGRRGGWNPLPYSQRQAMKEQEEQLIRSGNSPQSKKWNDYLRKFGHDVELYGVPEQLDNGDDSGDYTEDEQPSAEEMQFPAEAELIQKQLDEDRFEEDLEEDDLEEEEDETDQRGWVYILWSPAYPTWVVTGKAKNYKKRIKGYQTYSPNRDFELVGLAYVENRKDGENKLQDEIEKEHPGTRGKPSSKPSEWFEITQEQAYEILERLNPDSTFRNSPEEE